MTTEMKIIVFLLSLSTLAFVGCDKMTIDVHEVAVKVSENGLAHTDLGHYMGVSLYHAMADLAVASGEKADMDRVADVLIKIKSGEIPVTYTKFYDYTIGGQAAAMLAYRGRTEFMDEVLACADTMWMVQPRTSFDIMTSPSNAPRDAYWIDIAFTVTPFYLYSGLLSGNREYVDYGAFTALRMCSDLYDPESGLYHQGYNHKNCPGVSLDCWSRGNGWMAMALSVLLHDYPHDGRYWGQIVEESRRFFTAACKWQNERGLWHQEMTDFTSYEESSGSGLLLAGIGAAIEAGVLDRETYMPYFEKGFKGLMGYVDTDGGVGHCCRGNCVPGTGTKEDFKAIHYYYNENHSFSPIVMAAAQALRLGIRKIRLDVPQGSYNDSDRPRAYVRLITERKNDVAWENDRVAFRVYSQIVDNKDASGVDFWGKSVDYSVIDSWYTKEAAEGSYHVDEGTGCDFYNMGTGRGIGGTGIWNGDTIVCPKLYADVRIASNGPEMLDFTLIYDPYEAFGRSFIESKRVQMVCGTSFYKVTHTVTTSDGADAVLAVGLSTFGNPEVLCAADGKLFISEQISHKERVGIGSDSGNLNFESTVSGAVVADPSFADGTATSGSDVLQLIKVKSGEAVTYYVGADWNFQQNSGRWGGGRNFWEMTAVESSFETLNRLY